ncbi:MAG TPA: chorismate mutase [Jiangellaceae bacterium]|nr:chorismate mutase [Jiangellaceae bacterium]
MTVAPDQPATAVHRAVRIGTHVIGGTRLPVLAGPRRGADVVHISLRRHHGVASAEDELAQIRSSTAVPLVVEPFSADDLPAVGRYADGVVVGGAWMQDFRLLAAVGRTGLPVVLHRGHHCTVDEWLSSVEYVVAEGNDAVVLCESGSRRYWGGRTTLDLALVTEVRERSGRPVVVDVGDTPWLAGAAVASGADGVWLAEDAATEDVASALDATTTLTPVVRQVNPQSLRGCREAIDRVDAALASLLEYRVTLAGEVQRHKPVAGHAGRDRAREAEIVHAMAHRAPSLPRPQLTKIMDAVITAGLDVADRAGTGGPPVWRI